MQERVWAEMVIGLCVREGVGCDGDRFKCERGYRR